jgi:hypothetical protein
MYKTFLSAPPGEETGLQDDMTRKATKNEGDEEC